MTLEIAEASEQQAEPSDDESPRPQVSFEHFVLEYPQELAVQAGALGLWLDSIYEDYAGHLDQLELTEGGTRAGELEDDMVWLNHRLGLNAGENAAPLEAMRMTYREMTEAFESRSVFSQLRFRQARLYSSEELRRRLEAGEDLGMLKLSDDPENPWRIDWGFGARADLETGKVEFSGSASEQPFYLPIMVADPSASFLDQVELARERTGALLKDLLGIYRNVAPHFDRMIWFVALHEAAEFSIGRNIIRSSDRRWFADGLANYLAKERLFEVAPEPAAAALWVRMFNAKDQEAVAQVDLWEWKASEDQTPADKEYQDARYLLATETIAAIVEAHGPDIIPRWCAEIRKTPLEETDMATVGAAFASLTEGQDLDTYIERAKRFLLKGQ